MQHTKTSKIIPVRTWLAAAAVMLIAASALWYFLIKPTRHEQLYADYFQPDPGLASAMSSSDNYTFDRAMIDYKTGHYRSAIAAWDSLLLKKPANDTLHYFLASSWLALDEAGKAIGFFEKVMAASNSAFIRDAYWYAGLAALKEGNKQKAIEYIRLCEHPQKDALLLNLKE